MIPNLLSQNYYYLSKLFSGGGFDFPKFLQNELKVLTGLNMETIQMFVFCA